MRYLKKQVPSNFFLPKTNKRYLLNCKGGIIVIEVKGLRFSYPRDKKPTLKGIDFTIKKEQVIFNAGTKRRDAKSALIECGVGVFYLWI